MSHPVRENPAHDDVPLLVHDAWCDCRRVHQGEAQTGVVQIPLSSSSSSNSQSKQRPRHGGGAPSRASISACDTICPSASQVGTPGPQLNDAHCGTTSRTRRSHGIDAPWRFLFSAASPPPRPLVDSPFFWGRTTGAPSFHDPGLALTRWGQLPSHLRRGAPQPPWLRPAGRHLRRRVVRAVAMGRRWVWRRNRSERHIQVFARDQGARGADVDPL